MPNAPLYQESNKPETCSNCIYGQVGRSCLLYNFQYDPKFICESWARVEYLELERPHGFLIFRGKQTAVAAAEDNLTEEMPYLVTSDDEAYGVATLEKAEKLDLETFDTKAWAKQHSTYTEERKRWWPEATSFYVYKIKAFNGFDSSYPIQDGKIIVYAPTEDEKGLIEKVQRMPRIISLNDKAVSIDLIGNVSSEVNDLRIKNLLDSYFEGTQYKGIKEGQTSYPIYSLSLVRKPYIIPDSEKAHTSVMFGFFLDERTAQAIETLVATSIFPEDVVPFGANFTPPEEYHLTLSMLGKAADLLPQMEMIMRVAENLAASYEPLAGKIGGIGRFAKKQEDGTVPFYLTFDSAKLTGFREELIERLEAVGIECNKEHGFTPHITIGYLPEETDISRFKVPEFSLVFKALTVAWGGDMFSFPFRIEEAEKKVEKLLTILPEDEKAIWTEEYLAELPDESFLYVSPSGERYLPFRDRDGNIDYGHIRSALSQINKLNDENGEPLSDEVKQQIRDKLIKILEENPAKMYKAVWSGAYVNDLPDSSFLWIEAGGEKDEEGRTKPRNLRHLPYKDSEGNIDLPHLRNAIAQAPKLKDKEGNMLPEAQIKKLQDKARNLLDKNEKEFKNTFLGSLKNLVKSAAIYLGYFDEEEKEATFDIDFKQPNGVGVKTVDGEPWHFTWSSNSFIDRDREIFSSKALEEYVNGNFNPETGSWSIENGFFNFWHIAGTDFAEKKFQAIVGKFLVEAGPYLDNELGRKAKAFFTEYKNGHPILAPEGWGASVEYKYLPEERVKGTYEWTYVDRTSTLPLLAAANLFTYSTQEDIVALKENTDQFKAAIAIFGEEFVKGLIHQGETKTATLQEVGIQHKEAKVEEKPKTEEVKTEETTEEVPAEEQLNIEEVVKGVTSNLTLNLDEFSKEFSGSLTKMVEAVTSLSERVKQLEEGRKTAEELTSQPRWEVLLKNIASKAVETEVPTTDALISQKPEEAKEEKKEKKPIASHFFND